MGDFFQQFLNTARAKYKEADRATGGWLPGGGVASPLTRAKQEGERNMANQIRQQSQQYVGQPGRLAGKGQLSNVVRAATQAGTNPISVALGNPKSIEKVSQYYAQHPEMQNEFDLNTNMFLRYLSGTGAEGLKIAPEVGKQIYSDIQQREKQFLNPQYRESVINNPDNYSYIKQNLLAGRIPVLYGGISDAVAPDKALLPTDKGERWQLDKSLGSYWAEPTDNGYSIKDERYNFSYAPVNKGGIKGASSGVSIPGSVADLGRNLVRQGFGNPFTYTLNVNPSGAVKAYP